MPLESPTRCVIFVTCFPGTVLKFNYRPRQDKPNTSGKVESPNLTKFIQLKQLDISLENSSNATQIYYG